MDTPVKKKNDRLASFSNNIRGYRKKCKLTQQELAVLLGVTKQTVMRWETGRRVPDVLTVGAMAVIFGCSVDDILQQSPPMLSNDVYSLKRRVLELEEAVAGRRNVTHGIVPGRIRERVELLIRELQASGQSPSPIQSFAAAVVRSLADTGHDTLPTLLVLEVARIFGVPMSDLVMEETNGEVMDNNSKESAG